MSQTSAAVPVRSRSIGAVAVVYAGDYLNKLSGERIERECRAKLEEGARALVIDFKHTGLVNSIGVSILLGVIEAAERTGARLIFSDVAGQTSQLFEMLGLTKLVPLAPDEDTAIAALKEFASDPTIN